MKIPNEAVAEWARIITEDTGADLALELCDKILRKRCSLTGLATLAHQIEAKLKGAGVVRENSDKGLYSC
jgi:hypothetical protein